MYTMEISYQIVKLWIIPYQLIRWQNLIIGNILPISLYVKNNRLLIESVKIKLDKIWDLISREWHLQKTICYFDQPMKNNA
jgi:hypothetical protein